MSLRKPRSICKNLLFAFFLFFSNHIFSQSLPKAIALYSDAWKESNSADRMTIINSFWTEESVYEDPGYTAKGRIAFKKVIDDFWKDFPGATFEMGAVLSKGNFYTWEWSIFDSNKKLVLTGVDFAETDSNNRMLRLIGFWNTPPNVAAQKQ